MKIHLLSDLHLEFAPFELPAVDADVLVLAGDIDQGVRGLEPFAAVARTRPVLYIAGNHEYYRDIFPDLNRRLASRAQELGITFLENGVCRIGRTRFLGCTLWTDFLLRGEAQAEGLRHYAETHLNDYQIVRRGGNFSRLRATDTLSAHRASLDFLERTLAQPHDGPTVVVTHHAPTAQAGAPQHAGDALNAAFFSNLEPFIERHTVDLWLCGHTHFNLDVRIGKTRVLSNQRGYPHESLPGFDPARVVEV